MDDSPKTNKQTGKTMTEAHILIFIVTSLVLIITPGQDMILVMSRSISQGWKAGVATAAGIGTGLLGHTLLAALGLGAILQTSELLFTIMKIGGAVYLIYMGIRLILSSHSGLDINNLPALSTGNLFFQGAISNISNPKIAIFYFAYLPQFIPATETNTTALLLILGASFALLTFFVKGPVGYAAGKLSTWLRNRPSVISRIHKTSGLVLIGLGLRLAFGPKN